MPGQSFSKKDAQFAAKSLSDGRSWQWIADHFNCSATAARSRYYQYRKNLKAVGVQPKAAKAKAEKKPKAKPEKKPKEPSAAQKFKRQMVDAMLHSPVDTKPLERIRSLEATVAGLRQQLAWSRRSSSHSLRGGKFTLRASDHHYGDCNHLLSCGASLETKTIELLKIYQPDEIQIIAGDDWVAGRGIYKEQDLDMATTDIHEQITVGVMKARKFLLRIREVTAAPISWHVMRGNHCFANNVSLTETLFYQMGSCNEDIADLNYVMHWDCMTANLAHKGVYNVLVRHGFGYSKNSPNSPAFVAAVKDEILVKQREMQPHEQYRRVLSGHVHQLQVGWESVVGLYFDTTGGLQRNTRTRLGANQRPIGWICYVSPPDLESDIISPIAIQADEETYKREIADPHLSLLNKEDAARLVREYHSLMSARGKFVETDHGMPTAGRW